MKTAYSGTWITGLVITFTFLFVAFLSLSINYSKAFRVKNEVINFIEKYHGIYNSGSTANSVELINNYLKYNGYTAEGKCPIGSYGIRTRGTSMVEIKNNNRNTKFNYCVRKRSSSAANFKDRAYYEVTLFFKFNLPVIGTIFVFDIDGQSKDIIKPIDGKCSRTSTHIPKCYYGP